MNFQSKVKEWTHGCFGETIANNKGERNHRFLEEALELVQSCGATEGECHTLVEYVFSRPIGEKFQECGGVMITLSALCNAQGIDLDSAALCELARCWSKIEVIREKQKNKPKSSPLP